MRGNLIYITLQDGKIQIEYDGMERGITQDLLAAGIDEGAISQRLYCAIALAFWEEPQPVG